MEACILNFRVIQEHPSLIQAASYIAAAIAKEGGERPSSRRNHRAVVDDYESDDELQGMEPGVRFCFQFMKSALNITMEELLH